jgi:hypothetical protein
LEDSTSSMPPLRPCQPNRHPDHCPRLSSSSSSHAARFGRPAFAPAFAVSPSAPLPPLQIVDCCVGPWSSPPLLREVGMAVIIRAALSRPLAACCCQDVAPLSSPWRLDERPPPLRLRTASPSPPLLQNVDCCVGCHPLLRRGRRGQPSSLGWRRHVLWRLLLSGHRPLPGNVGSAVSVEGCGRPHLSSWQL